MLSRLFKNLTVLVFLVLIPLGTVWAGAKTALVIGNGAYKHLPALNNPVPEALDMKRALESAGFTVIYVANSSKTEMQGAVKRFKKELDKNGGVALFHYGGHGMQLGGKNYLVPVDANITEEWEVDSLCVDAGYILSAMESSKSDTNIVILDACRDNPLPGSTRSATRGFARMEAPTNSIIIYSAGEGETARDGLFTPILVRYIRQGGMEFSTMVKAVRKEVYEASGQKQRPAEYSMLMGEVWLTTPVQTEKSGPAETVVVETRKSPPVVVVETGGFVAIPGGSFRIGSPEDQEHRRNDEIPGQVTLSPFLMAAREVTFTEYDRFCDDTKRKKPSDEGWGRGDRPVINITWIDAVEYCNWLSSKDGLTPCYTIEKKKPVACDFSADGYRLPTEAEWEYACRAGTQTPWSFAVEPGRDVLNYSETDLGMTMPVGSFDPNPWGLHDMHGNVREWCWDAYGTYLPGNQVDPAGANPEPAGRLSRVHSNSDHVIRGGGWDSPAPRCRSAYRDSSDEADHNSDLGFRLVRRGR